jgi:hypothetical protein
VELEAMVDTSIVVVTCEEEAKVLSDEREELAVVDEVVEL